MKRGTGKVYCWIAVTGKPKDRVYEQLSLRGTGEHEDFPDSPIVGTSLPSNAILIVTDHAAQAILNRTALMQLSADCKLIACSVEEHCMVSTVSEWKLGQRTWSVQHDCDRGLFHLEQQGDVPVNLSPIYQSHRAKQEAAGGEKAKVDHIFDVPIELAKALTGLRHDQDVPGLGENPFEVLVSTASVVGRTTRWGKHLFSS